MLRCNVFIKNSQKFKYLIKIFHNFVFTIKFLNYVLFIASAIPKPL